MTPSDSPFARCYDLCEDHLAAIVLERLTYWWRHGTRMFKDAEWRAKPRGQLARECRMSEKQCRRALEILKAKHLIETEAHRFGTVGPVMHYRFLPRGMAYFPPPKETTSEPSVMALEGHNLVHNGGISSKNLYEVSKDTSTKFLDADAFLSGEVSGKDEGTAYEAEVLPKQKELMGEKCEKLLPKKNTPKAPSPAKAAIGAKLGISAAAILTAKKVKGVFPGTELPKVGKKGPALGKVWRDALAEAYPKNLQPPLTKKELGQLKMLAEKLQPLDPATVIQDVVADWIAFTYAAVSEGGAFKLPKKPEVGVILKFLNVAANFKPPKPEPAMPPKAFVIPTAAQLIAQDAEPQHVVASKEEIIASLWDTDVKG
ncbi:hypothetical protein B2G69_18235 [Methylorubrum zatmanii]|nr:hypothetical protein [Methylorubrum zatmanii]ARO55879.1 hypothetical protein B2G69_18235 [Methylorubrum zatmanii]